MIRKYPAGDQDRDHRIAPRRDTNPTFGEFGAIVYVYRLALEPKNLVLISMFLVNFIIQ